MGEGNVSAKLTWKEVEKIRILYSYGTITYAELAKEFGVDKSTIYQIVKRKTWKEQAADGSWV